MGLIVALIIIVGSIVVFVAIAKGITRGEIQVI